MAIAYIAFGCNLGDGRENFKLAFELMERDGIKIKKVSDIIETEPYGVIDQPNFLNGACEVETEHSPEELLKVLLAIELEMGRVRKRRWGERNIDLDLLFYEDEVRSSEFLTLPHPDMQNRDFVLVPMNEIAPDKFHPRLKKTIAELLQDYLSKKDNDGL